MLKELRDQNDNLNDGIVYYSPLAKTLSIALVHVHKMMNMHSASIVCKSNAFTHVHHIPHLSPQSSYCSWSQL